jgi:lipoprotein NlpD
MQNLNAMRMKKIRLLLLAMSAGLVAACATSPRTAAPVVERTSVVKTGEVSKQVAGTAKPASRSAESHAYYTVKKGDTLLHIALDVGQNYRDLVTWNNLANPNDIKVDQVLRVQSPEANAGSGVAQTGSVAITSGVDVRPLSTPSVPAAVTVTAINKSSPRGDKRPYSEAALAELQKPDTGMVVAVTAKIETPKMPDAKISDGKPSDLPAVGADEEMVGWMWPADGKIVATFDDGKKGIDIAGKVGQQVLAAGAGKVMYAGSGIRGYGNLVIVKHTNTLLSAYAHNKTILVKEGQSVSKGQKIAEMGNSDTDAVKLHFEIRQQGKPVDPSKFLPTK